MNKLLALILFVISGLGALNAQPLPWQTKIDPALLAAAATGKQVEFLVQLSERADLRPAAALADKRARGEYVYHRLVETARRSQAPLRRALEQRGLPQRAFWIDNLIWARGDLADLEFIAARSEVAHVYNNPSVRADLPPISSPSTPAAATAIEWNIQKVGAPAVWAAGFTGQGAVIAGQDTGYQWDQPALKNKYRGWDGTAADHNYNWHDAIHENNPNTPAGNKCGFDSPIPCDDQSHGTHTMGTMIGDDGQGNQVGMAPGARWIGCRNMEDGWGTPATYIECFEWFVAPTDLSNSKPRPDLAPAVINNSWSCPSSEGCTWDSLQQVVENVRAAGILVVVSAGNSGSGCSSVNNPAAIYAAAFSVGATDNKDQITGFSSRGPVTVDGSSRLKPDVSAPGVSVRSSVPGGSYGASSGTSMAAPHVSGLVALLISADPALAGQVDKLEELIRSSALDRTTSESCGGVPGSQVPNNTYGWGRIDAWSALLGARPDLFLHVFIPLTFYYGPTSSPSPLRR